MHNNYDTGYGSKTITGRPRALADKGMDAYVKQRSKKVKYSTITRELTDVKAILNWSVKRTPPLISHNPVRDYKKPAKQEFQYLRKSLSNETSVNSVKTTGRPSRAWALDIS